MKRCEPPERRNGCKWCGMWPCGDKVRFGRGGPEVGVRTACVCQDRRPQPSLVSRQALEAKKPASPRKRPALIGSLELGAGRVLLLDSAA